MWRDGQQKRVYVYRLLATGTIEEKAMPPLQGRLAQVVATVALPALSFLALAMTLWWCVLVGEVRMQTHVTAHYMERVQVYQRQLSKEGLQALVNNAAGGGAVGVAAEDDAPASTSGGPNIQSAEDLRDLFTLRSSTLSDVRREAKHSRVSRP